MFLFLHTDDFWRDHRRYAPPASASSNGPGHEAYGTVAVFQDPFGNKWDLLELPRRTDRQARG